jgi:hypothetical protein
MPLAEIGTRPVTVPPYLIDRGLMMSPGSMKSGTAPTITRLRGRHSIDNDGASVAKMPPKQHASGLGCIAAVLCEVLHD